MTLTEIFPDEEYRFTLRFGRGEPAAFFAATGHHAEVLAQRRHSLRIEPNTYAALLPEGVELLEETADLAREWNGFTPESEVEFPWEECLELGKFWEADYLLLKCEAGGEIRLCGGCLCFPSSWRLSDKVGKPIEAIHAGVPGLNDSIGPAIHKFLAGLKPGVAWLRHNWGLSRSPELNQHPDRGLPRLDKKVQADEVWLRVERHALVALPQSKGILFGIRIENHSLREVKADAVAARRLVHALETMPEEMARYKNLADARATLIRLLAGP
ncbi:MAG: heme-dependent oxidative N-demethylase subunit alpha family protein [Verrucomicrobiota bacterium]